MVGGTQGDSGKEWKDAAIASFYVSVSGMQRRERGVKLQRRKHSRVRGSCSALQLIWSV